MRVDVRSPWPQWTTLAAGALLLVSGALQLVVSAQLTLPITDSFVVPLASPFVSLLATIARAAGFVIAATGVHGELGFAANSKLGKAALIVWGLGELVFLILAMLPGMTDGLSAALGVTTVVLQIAVVLAAPTAAIAVARARVLTGWVRWTLLPLAIIEVLFAVLFSSPIGGTDFAMSVEVALAPWPTEFIEPVLTLVIAATLLTWGRLEAVKHRARLIHDAW